MRQNYIYLFSFFLLINFVSFAQKVTLIPTSVNGQNVGTSSINLGSASSAIVSLNVTVEMPFIPGDNGTITIFSLNGLNSNIVINGNGGSLFFGEGKTTSRSFVVTLTASDFSTSQGFVYAEYKTFSGVIYKSANILVTKNGTPPTTPPVSNSKREIGPYGGTPLFPEFTEYYDVAYQEWVDISGQVRKINSAFYDPIELFEKTVFNDGTVLIKNKFSYYVVDFLPNMDNLSISNIIEKDQYLINGENPQTIIGNQATESHSEKTPNTRRANTITTNLSNYQWQSRIKSPLTWFNMPNYFQTNGWKDISGATQINYTPPVTNLGMEYRRVILENQNDKSEYRNCATSNVIEIVPLNIDSTKNTICCNQTVKSGDYAIPITGISPTAVSYQWLISEDNINWKPIQDATKKDHIPTLISKAGGRDSTNNTQNIIQYYRRIVYDFQKNINYISNTIQINFETRSSSVNQSLKIYPNPTTTILNIENIKENLTISNIIISNSSGNVVTPNSSSIISPSLTQLNVTNLELGVYFINIMIREQGASRGFTYQSTFIKQ